MPPTFAAACFLLALPLSAQALEVLGVSRGARLVFPINVVDVFTFDQRSSAVGLFDAGVNRGGTQLVQNSSYIASSPDAIVLGRNSSLQSGAKLDTGVASSQAISESWVRMTFKASGPSMSTVVMGSVSDTMGGGDSPTSFHATLLDITSGETVFDFDTADFTRASGRPFGWNHRLLADHVYTFDWTLLVADAPGAGVKRAGNLLSLSILAQPIPEPGTAALMLAGLGVAAGVAWRRRSGSTPKRGHRLTPG